MMIMKSETRQNHKENKGRGISKDKTVRIPRHPENSKDDRKGYILH